MFMNFKTMNRSSNFGLVHQKDFRPIFDFTNRRVFKFLGNFSRNDFYCDVGSIEWISLGELFPIKALKIPRFRM